MAKLSAYLDIQMSHSDTERVNASSNKLQASQFAPSSDSRSTVLQKF